MGPRVVASTRGPGLAGSGSVRDREDLNVAPVRRTGGRHGPRRTGQHTLASGVRGSAPGLDGRTDRCIAGIRPDSDTVCAAGSGIDVVADALLVDVMPRIGRPDVAERSRQQGRPGGRRAAPVERRCTEDAVVTARGREVTSPPWIG